MSGGYFNYSNYSFENMADSINDVIANNDRNGYPPAVIEELSMAVRVFRRATVYARRVDYLLSGDDDEESFLVGLREDLEAADGA